MAALTLGVESPAPALRPPASEAPPVWPSAAAELAAANRAANVRALSLSQPDVVDAAPAFPTGSMQWTFARDGSLTCVDAAGRWWDGCSVPAAAARAVFKSLDVPGRVACFLRPGLAAQLAVVLEALRADQAVVAVCPDALGLRVMLHAANFSTAIKAGRLWFAAGGRSEDELARLFETHPGLPTPSQFIRLPSAAGELLDSTVSAAQKAFAAVNAARAVALAAHREHVPPARRARRLAVVAPSTFRLWDEAPTVLADVLERGAGDSDVEVRRLDTDQPRNASTLALAAALDGCDALLTADVARSDLPNVAPDRLPWLTWVTRRHVPPASAAGPHDRLLLADPSWRKAATNAGWPECRVHDAGWPLIRPAASPRPGAGTLAVIADTCPLDPPERLAEFSSHVLLWERLRINLAQDPFSVGDDPEDFLRRTLQQFGVDGNGLDRRLFLDRLIVPGYQQGVARVLLREKLPLRLYGAGWEQLAEFAPNAAGPVPDRWSLLRAARHAAALVHAWPDGHAHPIEALGRPVVRRTDAPGRSFVSNAMRALAGQSAPVSPTAPLDLPAILKWLGE